MTKLQVELGSVQRTLLLPLWGRARETQKRNPLLMDQAAASIIARLDYDFSTIAARMSPITQLAWIARCIHIDRTLRGFLAQNPRACVVNVGCGLDTTFERIDNGSLQWYDLDLPDVIRLRRDLIAEGERRKFLTASFLDSDWHGAVQPAEGIVFVAAGVFYYFEAAQVRRSLGALAKAFPGAEMVFDVCSPLGLKIANKRVIQDGGMDESSFLKWGVENARTIAGWDAGIEVMEVYPMFRGLKRRFSLRDMYGAFLSDALGIMSMVHLRLQAPSPREN